MKIAETTAIGSLPHHNIDAALGFAFSVSIPFLPQIPIRNPWEYMIAQTLEGLPGLQAEADGGATLDVNIWHSRAKAFSEKLERAFASQALDAFEAFEPSNATSSSWQPFLWELEERGAKRAKVQLAGPLTAQWAVRLSDGSPVEKYPDLSSQIYRLVLARSLAMVRRLRAQGVSPMIFLDEPGLYAFTATNPKHLVAFQELKLLVSTLRKEADVGIHCCSDTHWPSLMKAGVNWLSLDTSLSLRSLLADTASLREFAASGGRLSLGVVPTSIKFISQLNVAELHKSFMDAFDSAPGLDAALKTQLLREAVYTPACGLALHSTMDAESVLGFLQEFSRRMAESLASSHH